MEAEAFNKNMDVNAIFSCSWGPDDDGATVDGPHLMAAKAMKFGVDFGREGFGSIFVVASGNGGENGDNCNYDGYANSIYTVTIGAVDENGGMPYYAEECASMLGVTFSSGTLNKRDIVTTDWEPNVFAGSDAGGDGGGGGILGFRSIGGGGGNSGGYGDVKMGSGGMSGRSTSGGGVYRGASSSYGKNGGGCTERHTGTSAAAPLAAGMIALMLEARPCLTWRDVQYVVALTARKVDVEVAHWQNNGAGLAHSHKHGFGLLSAWRLVNAARVWKTVPWLTSYSFTEERKDWQIPKGRQSPLTITHTVTPRDIQGLSLFIVEHVQLTVWLSHPSRGKIEVKVVSPAGTVSMLAATRHKDNSSNGFNDWTFTTVRCWGEKPTGDWTILVTDHDDQGKLDKGRLNKYRLTLFGTPMTPAEFQDRRKLVEAAMTGEFLHQNYNLHCPPPPKYESVYAPVSERVLKIIILSGIFLLVMAIYETFEYIFCYDDEKKEARETIEANRRAARLAQETVAGDDEDFVQQTSALLQQQSSIEDTDPLARNSNNCAHRFPFVGRFSDSVGNNTEEQEEDEDDDFSTSSETSRLLYEDLASGNKRHSSGKSSRGVSKGQSSNHPPPVQDVIPLSTFSVCKGELPGQGMNEELSTAHLVGNVLVSSDDISSTSLPGLSVNRPIDSTGAGLSLPVQPHNGNSLSLNGYKLPS
ncbi:proprotein convertase subtilisin/kexin type 7 [Elysia marginata]|uniref:Proprotein convertase subtilisin/kexin type 7 n=1 Tax=Elysia marginata TaxID=1093978 RepID=A0AAV4J6Z0_9GAST|nr:proprotein convertase subtilisin/kexin type 7 [Elysia marginata]